MSFCSEKLTEIDRKARWCSPSSQHFGCLGVHFFWQSARCTWIRLPFIQIMTCMKHQDIWIHHDSCLFSWTADMNEQVSKTIQNFKTNRTCHFIPRMLSLEIYWHQWTLALWFSACSPCRLFDAYWKQFLSPRNLMKPRGRSDPLAALATKTQRSFGDMENERKLASCGSECCLHAFQLPSPNNPPNSAWLWNVSRSPSARNFLQYRLDGVSKEKVMRRLATAMKPQSAFEAKSQYKPTSIKSHETIQMSQFFMPYNLQLEQFAAFTLPLRHRAS